MVRRSPLVRLQRDERLIAMIRDGQAWAFEALWDRYQARLLAFCRHMLPSEQDAEDVLQDVFVSAHKAMLADNRQIKVKPWLYRIARNRCLNHLRRPVHEGSDEMMDEHPWGGGTTTAEQVQTRQELREVLVDVKHLPETQRSALLLREADALSYAEIAQTMDTTIPAVKSLLVRARITLAESSQARQLTCGEVQVELAEAAEGIAKATGPVRHHVKACEQCKDFRDELRSSSKALAALFPLGPLALLKDAVLAKLGGAGAGSASSAGGGAGAGGAGACGAGAAAGGAGAGASGMAAGGALGGAAAAGGGAGGIGGTLGVIGGAIGTKAAAGVATAAIVAAGAVEVNRYVVADSPEKRVTAERSISREPVPSHGTPTMVAAGNAATHEDAKPGSEEPAPAAQPAIGDGPPAEQQPAEPAPATTTPPGEEPPPADDGAPPSGHQGGVVTAIGTHEGPVTTAPAPSGSASGSSTESQPPPPSNSSPPPEESAPSAQVAPVVPVGG